jgi:hypothetical protein
LAGFLLTRFVAVLPGEDMSKHFASSLISVAAIGLAIAMAIAG